MSLKDDIKSGLADAATKVRAEKDIENALRADATAKQEQIAAMQARIDELQGQPGNWTDADVQEIQDGLAALNAAFDPDATVANVLTNTDNPPA